MASIATEQGINLAREVFRIFVGNELSSFDSEPSIFVIKAAARIICFDGFCGTACAVPRRSPRRLFGTREEIGCEDNGLDEMVLLLWFMNLHGAWLWSFLGVRRSNPASAFFIAVISIAPPCELVSSSNHRTCSLCGVLFFFSFGKREMKSMGQTKIFLSPGIKFLGCGFHGIHHVSVADYSIYSICIRTDLVFLKCDGFGRRALAKSDRPYCHHSSY